MNATKTASRLAWLGAIFSLAGCAGVVVVDAAIDLQVGGRDSTGKIWRAAPGDIVDLPLDPRRLSPLPDTRYRGNVFEWVIESSGGFLTGLIRSQRSGPVCFLFDEAQVSSNWQKDEIPLRVFTAFHFSDNKVRILRQNKPGGKETFVPPKLCFPAEKAERFIMSAETSALFPEGRHFNIRTRGSETTLIDKGIGNWIKLRVPIEYEGQREELEVTQTIKDSKARISYH